MTRIWILLLCLSVGYGQGGNLEAIRQIVREETKKVVSNEVKNLKLELKEETKLIVSNEIKNLRVELKVETAGIKGDIKELNGKIEGMKFIISLIVTGVGVMIGLFCVILAILGLPYFIQIFKRNERIAADIAYRYRDKAEIQANAIDRVEIQAMIEKALKEQANAIVEKAFKEKAELQKVG